MLVLFAVADLITPADGDSSGGIVVKTRYENAPKVVSAGISPN